MKTIMWIGWWSRITNHGSRVVKFSHRYRYYD